MSTDVMVKQVYGFDVSLLGKEEKVLSTPIPQYDTNTGKLLPQEKWISKYEYRFIFNDGRKSLDSKNRTVIDGNCRITEFYQFMKDTGLEHFGGEQPVIIGVSYGSSYYGMYDDAIINHNEPTDLIKERVETACKKFNLPQPSKHIYIGFSY